MTHFLGKDDPTPTPTGKSPSPQPNPNGHTSPDGRGGSTSLVVLQFVAIVRGEWRVQAPHSPFRVESVTAEERYCFRCCAARDHDVVKGFDAEFPDTYCEMFICRCCGASGSLSGV